MKRNIVTAGYYLLVIAMAVMMAAPACGCVHIGEEAKQGIQALDDYGCSSCHTIPGISQANGIVGPPLHFWGSRSYIAGALVNTPDNLVDWLMDPQAVEPGTAMPQMGVSETDARNMGAYLYTLHTGSHGRVSIRGYSGDNLPPFIPDFAD
ncbi:MAG: hypothetical protein JW954_01125 [Dehalococcoidaceae bacterium]|nr:hypothetical protein [Dehalococcoidaceae bacterium]